MTQIQNSGGNRALVAYCYKDNFTDAEQIQFSQTINGVLSDIGVKGWADEYVIIEPSRTVNVSLLSGAWARSLKIGNCGGDLIVGVYFYNAPRAPEPDPDADPDEESEPAPSITSLVCAALQEAFSDGKCGASAFVINPETPDFELEVE